MYSWLYFIRWLACDGGWSVIFLAFSSSHTQSVGAEILTHKCLPWLGFESPTSLSLHCWTKQLATQRALLCAVWHTAVYLFTETVEEEEEEQLDEEEEEDVPPSMSVCLAKSLGVSASQVQLQKASFFGCDDQDDFPDEDYLHGEQLKALLILWQLLLKWLCSLLRKENWKQIVMYAESWLSITSCNSRVKKCLKHKKWVTDTINMKALN